MTMHQIVSLKMVIFFFFSGPWPPVGSQEVRLSAGKGSLGERRMRGTVAGGGEGCPSLSARGEHAATLPPGGHPSTEMSAAGPPRLSGYLPPGPRQSGAPGA